MEIVINKFGTRLRIRNGLFELSNKDGTHKLAPNKIDRIVMGRAVSLSSDVLLKAVEHEIDVLIVDALGQPQARIWSPRFGSISTIRRQQIGFSTSRQGGEWIRACLATRMQGQAVILRQLAKDRPAKKELLLEGAAFIEEKREKLLQSAFEGLNDSIKSSFRGWEGQAAKKYFFCLGRSVPQAYTFEKRSRRPARDIFNAVLNYLYGMLYGHVEICLIKAGLDPYLGVFHRDGYNRPSLVFDDIENYRSWADAVCLQLVFRQSIGEEMLEARKKGFRLNQLGKRLVIASMNDFLEETIQLNKRRRSRKTHMQLAAHELAQRVLKLEKEQQKPF